jgi:hypothetical protein
MDEFSSVDIMHMELGGKHLNSLSIKIQFLKRLQSVNAVPPTPKRMWRATEAF